MISHVHLYKHVLVHNYIFMYDTYFSLYAIQFCSQQNPTVDESKSKDQLMEFKTSRSPEYQTVSLIIFLYFLPVVPFVQKF